LLPMCLAIPGRLVEIEQSEALLSMGLVDFGGVKRRVCLAYVPEANVGDYVLVHVGFAISRLDEQEAQERLDLISESGLLETAVGERDPEEEARAAAGVPS
jgi:hydrogenase expression/formation protein HypC